MITSVQVLPPVLWILLLGCVHVYLLYHPLQALSGSSLRLGWLLVPSPPISTPFTSVPACCHTLISAVCYFSLYSAMHQQYFCRVNVTEWLNGKLKRMQRSLELMCWVLCFLKRPANSGLPPKQPLKWSDTV